MKSKYFTMKFIFLLSVICFVYSQTHENEPEYKFCTTLPENVVCAFGDDLELNLYIDNFVPETLEENLKRNNIQVKELILNSVHNVLVSFVNNIKALRIFNCTGIDIDPRLNVQTLEIVNSTFVPSQPFKVC